MSTNNFVCDKYKEYIKKAQAPKIEFKATLPDAVIVDLDGTMAFSSHREWWDNSKVKDDTYNTLLAFMLDTLRQKHVMIIYLRGRDESCRDVTLDWMLSKKLKFDDLIMRPEGNDDRDDDLKEKLFNSHIRDNYNMLAVFEDRPIVINRFRKMGLFVLDCNQIENYREVF